MPRRLPFLDALRGAAALAVVWFHFSQRSPLHESLAPALPRALNWSLANGYVGVSVFFVLSGFVIAMSIANARITWQYFARFALRRSLRLDPPYWVTLAVASALLVIANRRIASGQVLAHIFYLQGILGYKQIVAAFWTLSFEIQFYLVLVLFVWLAQRWRGHTGVVVALVPWLVSLTYLAAGRTANGFFIEWWYAFALGVATYGMLAGRLRKAYWGFALLVSAIAASIGFIPHDISPPAVIVAAFGIGIAGLSGRLASWTGGPVLQYLGRISYSLYLFHFVGNVACEMGGARSSGPLAAVGWFAVATAYSIAAAHVFYILVERPSHRLSRRVRQSGPPSVNDERRVAGPLMFGRVSTNIVAGR